MYTTHLWIVSLKVTIQRTTKGYSQNKWNEKLIRRRTKSKFLQQYNKVIWTRIKMKFQACVPGNLFLFFCKLNFVNSFQKIIMPKKKIKLPNKTWPSNAQFKEWIQKPRNWISLDLKIICVIYITEYES